MTTLPDAIQQDSTSFGAWERMVRGESDIPASLVRKFVRLGNNAHFPNDAQYIGKSVVRKRYYLLFYFRAGNHKRGYEVYATYDKQTKVFIDAVAFLRYCHACDPKELPAFAYYKDLRFNAIEVRYFRMPNTRMKIHESMVKILRTTIWEIDSTGRFYET